jgi:phthiocerol/phenolphthiocerol synthesis type-I polyketide synthase E
MNPQTAANDQDARIAIVGMACRLPGAADPQAFWRNLREGVESISFFDDDTLLANGVPTDVIGDKAFVKAGSLLEDCDRFDAEFFGFSPAEAVLMDPQIRVLLECAWEAIEHAGYDTSRYTGRVGVFSGMSMNSYLLNLSSLNAHARNGQALQARILNDKDFLSTWISYKLDLRGPSVSVQTACSTSLVALHLACQSLLNGESDMAMAGGVCIDGVRQLGYFAYDGSILSNDGHCRVFDADASGTICGNGAGMVVIKRLQDAIADGDTVHAVILGTAINNDGALKASYTAPSIEGQIDVIAEALGVAGVGADSIDYVEAHGTGTRIGDPAEIAAISEVFAGQSDRTGYCAIGSVKSNIGHLDAAAGVAGLIKAVLALREGELPPSLHFRAPNPQIDFAATPFYVVDRLQPWPRRAHPRRAGLSSFGVGGTNAHVVLEQAPAPLRREAAATGPQLLVVSARTRAALQRAKARLANFLQAYPEVALDDVAYTLRQGRRAMPSRFACVASDAAEAIAALRDESVAPVSASEQFDGAVFLFPGQGTQHIGMAQALYRGFPAFRETFDRCADALRASLGRDLREWLFVGNGEIASADDSALDNTAFAQPALFAVELSLARCLIALGVKPKAMLGHSLGEYVAATVAGVMTESDALRVVAARARMMAAMAPGAMLAVPMSEAAVRDALAAAPNCELAAVNAAEVCVVSGPFAAIDALDARLRGQGVECRRLRTSHAFHSAAMAPMLAEFEALMRGIRLQAPKLPYLSNVTGGWISAEQATDPAYWSRHLRTTVRFHDGIARLLREGHRLMLEVGPGASLSGLLRRLRGDDAPQALQTLRHPAREERDPQMLLQAIGRCWQAGARIDWATFGAAASHRRIPLPTYPFGGGCYWLPSASASARIVDADALIQAGIRDVEAPDAEPDTQRTAYEAPRDELEELLAELWQQCLGVPRVGIFDNFFELGGQSLMASQLVVRINERLGVEMPVETLFAAPRIAELAERIVELDSGEATDAYEAETSNA